MEAFPVEHDDPTAEIIRDFIVGFKGMNTSEMDAVAQSLSRPNTREDAEAANCDASWAAMRQTREFFRTLAKSLGHDRPSTESLGHE